VATAVAPWSGAAPPVKVKEHEEKVAQCTWLSARGSYPCVK